MRNKYLFRVFPYPGIETVCWENWDFERQQHAPHMGDRIFQTFKVKTV